MDWILVGSYAGKAVDAFVDVGVCDSRCIVLASVLQCIYTINRQRLRGAAPFAFLPHASKLTSVTQLKPTHVLPSLLPALTDANPSNYHWVLSQAFSFAVLLLLLEIKLVRGVLPGWIQRLYTININQSDVAQQGKKLLPHLHGLLQ